MEMPQESLAFQAPSTREPALGSFYINNQRFLIIASKPQISAETPPQPKLSEREGSTPNFDKRPPLDGHRILYRFRLPDALGGQTLAIVKPPPEATDPVERLTSREFEIVRLVAQGWANKQIANRLNISQWTVSTHLRRIFLKLEVATRAELVYRCAGSL